MSRRALRKLQSGGSGSKHSTDLEHGQLLSESDDTDLSPSHKRAGLRKTSVTNPYEVLERERTPSDEEAKEDDDDDFDVMLENGQKEGERGTDDKTQMTDSLKRKKKKKKRKVKESSKEEDVEVVAQEVKHMLGEMESSCEAATSAHGSTTSSPVHELLSIDYRNLQPDNEMRRIFGSKVVDTGKRKMRGRIHVRTTKLVVPRHNWPHIGKSGISMNLLESRNGLQYFKFEHSSAYQQTQFQFLDAVESLNPDNIVAVINAHPYHVDALLQLSDIMHLGEDMQMAMELIERALFCCENSFHSLFNIAQGNCRLEYKYSENRSFYVALFKHIKYVGQKGCHRTALEFCKVLLSLNPDGDPLAVSLMIDYYALKSVEYAYLIKFYEELEPMRNLSQLPNFAFSVALVKFHLGGASRANDDANKRRAEADGELQRALLAYPAMLMCLLDKCSIQPDARVAQHSFFRSLCHTSHPSALLSLVHLYVGRCCHLWKEPKVLTWLEVNVQKVLDQVDGGGHDPEIAAMAEKRMSRYQKMPRDIYRHILMSEVKDATATLPPDMSRNAMMSFDPLPPADSVTSYVRPVRQHAETDQGILHVLFRSLFPNYAIEEAQRQMGIQNPQAAPRRAQQAQPLERDGRQGEGVGGEERGAEGGGDTQDFRRSVTSLLDAMRDLLTNIHLPDVEQDGDADDSDEEADN